MDGAGGKLLVGLLFIGCGSTGAQEAARCEGANCGPAEPAKCFGSGIRCSSPTPELLELGPEIVCATSSPGKAEIVWMKDLGEVECPLGRCAPVVGAVTVDSSGSLWATSSLVLPGPDVFMGGTDYGSLLARFTADGAPAFEVTTDFRTRLSGPAARGSSPFPGRQGHVWWVAPTTGAPGLELRDYAPDGTLVSSRRLVDNARRGTAVIEPDGSLVLVYEYSDLGVVSQDAGGGSTERPRIDTDVARFDAEGRVLWNQIASRVLGLGNTDGVQAAITPSLDATLLVGVVKADLAPAHALVARLDAEGNVTWVRTMENAQPSTPVFLPDGSAMMTFQRTDDPSAPPQVLKIDKSGNAEWHFTSNGFGFTEPSLVGVDEDGRVWGTSYSFGGTNVDAISMDGAQCDIWSLGAPTCTTVTDGSTYCTSIALAPTRGGIAYFGGASVAGEAKFGAAP